MSWTILICALVLAAALPALAAAPTARRSWPLTVRAPAQFDATLARASFALAPGLRHPGMSIALAGPNGLDYVAAARLRTQPARRLVALVVVINRRPQGSLAPDLVAINLRTRLGRALPKPSLVERVNVHGAPGPAPRGLCSTPPTGSLRAGDLALLLSAGPKAPGGTPTELIAHAFDSACGRPM
jgi:hypothetical protein